MLSYNELVSYLMLNAVLRIIITTLMNKLSYLLSALNYFPL